MLALLDLQTDFQELALAAGPNPRFGWRYETDREGFLQETYRILVGDSADFSRIVWDSGEVSSRAQLAEYAGPALKNRAVYFWKCLASGCGERCESAPVRFETAPADEDWLGFWVSTPISSMGSALCFRKTFVLRDVPVVRARAYVCGLGYHECYVNGCKLGTDVLQPGATDYSKRVLYCTYAFEDRLRPGKNAIGTLVGNGWYGNRKLLMQIYVDYADGTFDEYHTANCNGWWATGSSVICNSIYDGEIFDARREQLLEGWSTPEYRSGWDNGWMYTYLVDKPGGRLVPQTVDPIRVVGEIVPVARRAVSETCFVFDMGQIFSGWARIKVRGKRGAKVSIRYAEGVNADGRVNQLNLRSAKCRDLYILRGDRAVEEYAPRFTYHGFGYVEIALEGELELLEVAGQYVRSSVPRIGKFECSDERLNRLHRNAVITEGSNLHSIMTDCPQRDERLGWLNDITSRIYQTECNYDMRRFFPKFLDDIADTQDERGAIADTAPFYTGGRPADPVSVCFLLIGLHCYRRYGDRRPIERHYEDFKRWVSLLSELADEDGILRYSPYGDWCPPGDFRPEDPPFNRDAPGELVSTAYYYWHAACMAEIAEILERRGDRETYASLAAEIRSSFRAKFLRADGKGFGTGSQSCNAIALGLNLAEGEDRRQAEEALLSDVVARGHHPTTGNQAYRHMFEALTDAGHARDVFLMLVNPTYPGWGYMLAKGATTVWERWEDEMQNTMHSFCHPMFASYDAWFYHRLAGLGFSPESVGDDRLVYAPRLIPELTFCSAELRTVRGLAKISWKRENGGIRYRFTVPPNTVAELRLPGIAQESAGTGTYELKTEEQE